MNLFKFKQLSSSQIKDIPVHLSLLNVQWSGVIELYRQVKIILLISRQSVFG